jgi:MAE_28990/MAE_18760-like HEPN
MWASLLLEIEERCLAARTYLAAVAGPPGDPPAIPTPPHEVTAKGLLFVQLYAVYEYTVTSMVRAAVTQLKTQGISPKDARIELLSLLLNGELQSLSEPLNTAKWRSRLDFLRKINSSDPCTTPDTVFPNEGSHYRKEQIEMIWEIFGVTASVVPNGRATGLILELVDNRNMVAHGGRTPEEVGRAVSKASAFEKIALTKKLCDYLTTTLQYHCAHAPNLAR